MAARRLCQAAGQTGHSRPMQWLSFRTSLALLEHFQRGKERFIQLHVEVVLWRDALESRMHQAHLRHRTGDHGQSGDA